MTNAKTSYDVITVAKSIGENIVNLQVSAANTDTLTKTLQETADKLREAKIVFGKSVKTCSWRKGIADTITTMAKDKTAAKTCMNYVTSFVSAVNTGSEFSLSDSKGKAKGKGKGTATTEFSTLLAKAFSHADFCKVMGDLQYDFEQKYQDDQSPSLILLIQDYLESEGFEIAE
jgi:hypothetical protein